MESMSLDRAILVRCEAPSLSLEVATLLAADSGHSGQDALCWVLGLDIKTLAVLEQRDWILMAAQTSSVSYRQPLTLEKLLTVMATGKVSEDVVSNMMHLVDEAPLQVVVMAAERTGQPLAAIWKFIQEFSMEVGAHRQVWRSAMTAEEAHCTLLH